MPLYENDRNAQNRIKVKKEWKDAVVFGMDNTIEEIVAKINEKFKSSKRPSPSHSTAGMGLTGVQ